MFLSGCLAHLLHRMLEGSGVMGADFLAAVSHLKQDLGPNFHEPCIKQEQQLVHCLKSLQAKTG